MGFQGRSKGVPGSIPPGGEQSLHGVSEGFESILRSFRSIPGVFERLSGGPRGVPGMFYGISGAFYWALEEIQEVSRGNPGGLRGLQDVSCGFGGFRESQSQSFLGHSMGFHEVLGSLRGFHSNSGESQEVSRAFHEVS